MDDMGQSGIAMKNQLNQLGLTAIDQAKDRQSFENDDTQNQNLFSGDFTTGLDVQNNESIEKESDESSFEDVNKFLKNNDVSLNVSGVHFG